MPLTQISLRRGKSAAYRTALLDGVYQAMRESFDVPEDDRFMTICECDAPDFSYGETYLGIARSHDLVIVQITAKNSRTVTQKRALYRSIAARLADNPGVRPQDVFINLVEVAPENWSFGHGLAQLAPREPQP